MREENTQYVSLINTRWLIGKFSVCSDCRQIIQQTIGRKNMFYHEKYSKH